MIAPFLIGPRVYYRALELADGPLFVRWMNDPDISIFVASGTMPQNELREREFIERMTSSSTDVVLTACLRAPLDDQAADTPIGVCGLHGIDPVHRFATLGVMVGERAVQDRGLGTEMTRLMVDHAFDNLNLERVELAVYEHNPRALAVYQKLGFLEEGRLVKRRWKRGAWRDEILMAVRRDAWLAARK